DVLDLVPGVQKTDNPGLGKTSQIATRGEESDKLSAFGTLVMVDGIPLSNNANLQFERYTSNATGNSNVGRGADLRLIPADNVATIEVVTGMPSVRYGDMTSGLINVQTKIGSQPHRLKMKSNPDTEEANLGGGFEMGESGLSYNVNAARSERDIRKDGDEYVRLTGQVVHNIALFDDALTLNTKIHGQKIFDEEQPKGDVQRIRNYNRGHTLGFATWGKYAFIAGISDLDFNTYLTYRKEDSHRSKLIQSDLRILPTGDTVSSYIGQVETRGNEWTLGGRLEWNNTFFTGDFIHKTLIGTDLQYNANTGEGLLLDTLFNYYGSSSGRVPYSFDSIPGQLLASVYAEDRISGRLGVDFTLSFGVRYEMYRPFGIDFGGLFGEGDFVKSHQGSFLNPRFSLLLALSDKNQLRLSGGYSSKSPPMSSIFPPPDVLRWRNPVAQAVTYFQPNTWVPGLRGYREGQLEVSFDQKLFGSAGVTLTGYYRERKHEPESHDYPVFASAVSGGKTVFYFVDKYQLYMNDGWTQSKGVEFSIRTGTIRPLNMDFRIVGAYSYTRSGRSEWTFYETPDVSKGQYPNYPVQGGGTDTLIGWRYPPGIHWADRFILNYYLRYTVAPLGLWVTLRAEQVLVERYQDGQRPVDYSLLTPADAAERAFDESIRAMYTKWLVNINVSKSLFKGAEISFYVNNVFDDPAHISYLYSATEYSAKSRNPALFYGIEFSIIVDDLFGKGE
ncbi:MAG TPA: TonB-dependent receptor plug domain-containing protein, partial [Bacteroidota bacterium]|nr:TonB-dependent receptor plug domain-containing protein [Bacteroidota bacterium]